VQYHGWVKRGADWPYATFRHLVQGVFGIVPMFRVGTIKARMHAAFQNAFAIIKHRKPGQVGPDGLA